MMLMSIAFASVVWIAALVLCFVVLRRPTPVDLLLGMLCLTLTSEWYIEVAGLVVSWVYDPLFLMAVPVFTLVILHHKHYRNRYVFLLLCLFAIYQLWSVVARFAQLGNLNPLQPFWSTYRNDLHALVFLLGGIVLAWRPVQVQRRVLVLLIASFALEALIGIVQTAAGGRFLTDFGTGRYLGLFTPLPVQMQLPSGLVELLLSGGADNGIFVGSIYRAVGTHRHSNWFAVSMVGGLALCLAVIVSQRRSWLRWWAIGAGGVMLLALLLSFTRTGYLAFAAMCGWYVVFWESLTGRIRTAAIGLLLLLLVPMLLLVGGPSIQNALFQLGDTAVARLAKLFQPGQADEFQFRTAVWNLALSRIAEAPLFGPPAPMRLNEIIPWLTIDVELPLHNQLMTSMYEGGYVLGLLYLLIHGWLFWISLRLRRYARRDAWVALWALAANLCFVGMAIESIGINWLSGSSLPGLFWLLAGAMTMQYRVVLATAPTPLATQSVAPATQPVFLLEK